MTVSYKLGSGPFSKDNLRIAWTDKAGAHAWKPGDQDGKNLGGVPGTMGGRSMVAVTDPGPLTRNGYYRSTTAAPHCSTRRRIGSNRGRRRIVRTGTSSCTATILRVHLTEMSKLIGPIPMLPRYVFGSWFGSRAGYSDEQWKMIVDRFREERLPVDMLVLDSGPCEDGLGGLRLDFEQMPDPKEFLAWMKHHHVKVTMNEHYAP